MAKTQIPSVYDSLFEEFTVPSFAEFVDGDRDGMLLYPIRIIMRYQSRTKQFMPECSRLFVSKTTRKKQVSKNTILLWIRSVISHTSLSATDKDCWAVMVRCMKFERKVLHFSLGRTVQSSWYLVIQTIFSALYLSSYHPQVYGYSLHWPCGGSLRGHIACYPQWLWCFISHFWLFVMVYVYPTFSSSS